MGGKKNIDTEDLLRFSFSCWKRREETEEYATMLCRPPWCWNGSTFNLIDCSLFSFGEGTNWRQKSSHCKHKMQNNHRWITKIVPFLGRTIFLLLGEVTFFPLPWKKSVNLKYFEIITSLITYTQRNQCCILFCGWVYGRKGLVIGYKCRNLIYSSWYGNLEFACTRISVVLESLALPRNFIQPWLWPYFLTKCA